jgi:RAB protein geranylgeranyltransferase component A
MTTETVKKQPSREEASLDGEGVDVVINGSDLPQVICAASLAGLGYKVLLLEPSETYGGCTSGPLSAALLFEDLDSATDNKHLKGPVRVVANGGNRLTELRSQALANASAFVLELQPRFYFAADAFLDLLVGSGAASYLFFQPVDSLFWLQASSNTVADTVVIDVPCTKAAIARSHDLGLTEKRLLMRCLRSCFVLSSAATEYDPHSPAMDITDEERREMNRRWSAAGDSATLLQQLEEAFASAPSDQQWKRVAALVHDIYAWGIEDMPTAPATWRCSIDRLERFIQSVMRFHAATPFLCCKYGSNEIIQAFARRCAVKGGILAMDRSIMASAACDAEQGPDENGAGFVVETNHGERIFCRIGVISPQYDSNIHVDAKLVLRFAGLTSEALRLGEPGRTNRAATGHAFFIARFNEGALAAASSYSSATLYIWQISSAAGICMPGYYVVYAECDLQRLPRQQVANTESTASALHTFRDMLAHVLRCIAPAACEACDDDVAVLESVFAAYACYEAPAPPSGFSVQTRDGSANVSVPYSYARMDGIPHAIRQILEHIVGDDQRAASSLDVFFGISPPPEGSS